MPADLHWFKYEAYFTWITGFLLLAVIYYLGANDLLIDPRVMELTPLKAIGISLGGLAAGWIIYDLLCRSPIGERTGLLAFLVFLLACAASYGFTQVFSGRAAFVHIGAFLGTIMAANVFFIIIPNQKKTVAALIAGEKPDPVLEQIGKTRSVHNNYLTLPVVFLMISSHYPLLFATRFNWLIVAIVLAIGPVIRHFFNSRHEGKGSPWWTWAVAAAGMLAIAWLSGAGPRGAAFGQLPATPQFAAVESIVLSRCSMCHASQPVWLGFAAAPGGVRLDNAERIRLHARLIEIHAVRSHAMPPGNVTFMTADERRILAAWLAAGAPAK